MKVVIAIDRGGGRIAEEVIKIWNYDTRIARLKFLFFLVVAY